MKKLKEYIPLIIFIVTALLSIVLEKYRVAVFILAITALLSVLSIVVLSFVKAKCATNAISLLVAGILLPTRIFSKYMYTAKSVLPRNQTSSDFLIWAVVALVIILAGCTVILGRFTIKERLIYFVIHLVLFGMLFAGAYQFANYAFDTSETKQMECEIIKQLGEPFTRERFGKSYIEYQVKATSNDIVIETLEIPEDYTLKSGDKVKITYRSGLFEPIYYTEYDTSIWIP